MIFLEITIKNVGDDFFETQYRMTVQTGDVMRRCGNEWWLGVVSNRSMGGAGKSASKR